VCSRRQNGAQRKKAGVAGTLDSEAITARWLTPKATLHRDGRRHNGLAGGKEGEICVTGSDHDG